jgi:hypothetical protein
MLRLTVLLLLLANAAYFAWSQGLLAPWGVAPAQQSEPQRLGLQIKPQAVRILDREETGRFEGAAAGTASKPQECLQAGVFEQGQVASLKQVLERWPSGSWVLEPAVESALAGQLLTLPAVDDNLRPRLEELRPALNGKNLRPCR